MLLLWVLIDLIVFFGIIIGGGLILIVLMVFCIEGL